MDSGRLIRVPQKIGRYLTGNVIGHGHSALVINATDTDTNEIFAMKVFDRQDLTGTKLSQEIQRERELIMTLDHPNIVQAQAMIETDALFCIVLDKCGRGDLFSLLVDGKLTQNDEKVDIVTEIVKGVQYLHQLGVVHGDLKLENVGMTDDHEIKLMDFGYSKRKGMVADGMRDMTLSYAAPEMFGKAPYDAEKAEIWSLGILILILFGRRMPYWSGPEEDVIKQILAHQIVWPATMDPMAKALVERLTAMDPKARPSIAEVLSHPFFGNRFPSPLSSSPSPCLVFSKPKVLLPFTRAKTAWFESTEK
jgi:serine/threonine protein kinase